MPRGQNQTTGYPGLCSSPRCETYLFRDSLASYGGDSASRCQRHVLTMDFDSGAVSVSDIPTRKKGCEAFTETDSYRLVRGNYYVDTSPGNNMDKSKK
jgi:hypothetical protein